MKTIKLKSIDLEQLKVKCDLHYTCVFIKKLLHVPTSLFVLGNHVVGVQSSKSYRDLRIDLSIEIKQHCDNLLGKEYSDTLIKCTNSIDHAGINKIITEAIYEKLKEAVELNTEKVGG